MTQVAAVEVPLNMGAAAQQTAALVDQFVFFPSPPNKFWKILAQLKPPQPFSPHAVTLRFLSITSNHFRFFPQKDGRGDAVRVIRTNTSEHASTAGHSAAAFAHSVCPRQGRLCSTCTTAAHWWDPRRQRPFSTRGDK